MSCIVIGPALLDSLKWRACGHGYNADAGGAMVFFVWVDGQLRGFSSSHEDALLMAERVAAKDGSAVRDFNLDHWQKTIEAAGSPPAL